MLPLGGDSLAVLQGDQTLSVFRGGVRAASRRLASPGDDFETPEPMGVFADGSLLFRSRFPWDTTATGIGHRRARLLRYAIDGSILATLADLTDDAVLTAERGAYLFAPAALYAAGDSTVWYGTADRYEVRELAPDAFVISWCGVAPDKYRPDVVSRNPLWSSLPAVRENRVFCVPEAYLGRPGPRLVEGIRALREVMAALGRPTR